MPLSPSLVDRARAVVPANPQPQDKPAISLRVARTLHDWLLVPGILDPPLTVLPNLVVEGRVSLLSGREKVGKSTLICGAISAATRGKPVLGKPMLGSVTALHYTNDEPAADTIRRYQSLGADEYSLSIEDMPRSVGELREKLEVDVLAIDPDVVIVDNLSRALAFSGIDPNSSREVEPALAMLVDFFHSRNLAAILLYHTNKGGREYRGSTAIGAVVDDILTLRRRGKPEEDDFEEEAPDDGRRLLTQDGRNLRGRVHLSCINGAYGLYDETHAPRQKIIEILDLHGSVKSKNELVKLAGGRRDVALQTIAALIADGTVTQSQHRLRLAASVSSERFPERGTVAGTTAGTSSRVGKVPASEMGTDTRTEQYTLTPEEEENHFRIYGDEQPRRTLQPDTNR